MPTTASTQVTNPVATPPIPNDVHGWESRLRIKRSNIRTVLADAIGHFYVMFTVKAHHVPFMLWLTNSADPTMNDVEFGIYNAPINGDYANNDPTDVNGVTSRDVIFNDDLSAGTELRQVMGIGPNAVLADNIGAHRFWEIAGLTPAQEPRVGTEYDLCMVPNTNPTGDGEYTFYLFYSAGD